MCVLTLRTVLLAALCCLIAFAVFIALVKSAESDTSGNNNAPTNAPTTTTGTTFGSTGASTSSTNGGIAAVGFKPSYAWVLVLLACVFSLVATVMTPMIKTESYASAHLTEQLMAR